MSKIDIGGVINIAGKVATALNQQAQDPRVSLEPKDVPKVTVAVENVVRDEVAKVTNTAEAIIENMANREPLWQSRNMWGSGIVIAASLAGLLGYTFSAEDQKAATDAVMGVVQVIPMVITAASGAWIMINRIFVAKKPLGK